MATKTINTVLADRVKQLNGSAVKVEGKSTPHRVAIPAPNMQTVTFIIVGTAPLVGNKFSSRALEDIRTKQAAGSVAGSKRVRQPKDFQQLFRDATHRAVEGWCGIPAPAFRNGMISACRTVGFKMTLAKLSLFIEADGYDSTDGTPLVRITKHAEPTQGEHFVRNDDGSCDIRARPVWQAGWEAKVRVKYDGDQFCLTDVANLMARVGGQVGICAGRPDSKNSPGMGWGLFAIKES